MHVDIICVPALLVGSASTGCLHCGFRYKIAEQTRSLNRHVQLDQ